VHHDHSLLDVSAPQQKPQQQQQQQQPGRSPRDDGAVANDATPETSSAGVAAVGSGKRKSPPDDRYL